MKLAFVFGVITLSVVWFVALWLGISFLVATVSGWRRLGVLYETGPFDGATFKTAGYLGPSRYRGRALILGTTHTGLYLNVAAPFRVGTRPLLIPWREIEVSPAASAGRIPLVTFEFPKAATRLRVAESVAQRLLAGRPASH
jgi:hypothetical protein